MTAPLGLRKNLTIYRYLTGPDDISFCHRVTKALSEGWALYGGPTLTFDAASARVICGQAITKDVDGVEYSPDSRSVSALVPHGVDGRGPRNRR